MHERHRPGRPLWVGGARILGGAALALALAGCAVAPVQDRPPISLPDRYSLLAARPEAPPAMAQWWRGLQDPVLNQLVAQGLTGSVSLAEARARLREAEALSRRAGNLTAGNATLSVDGGEGTDSATAGLSLLLDPFGGRRRAAEAAQARAQAARYGVQDARLALLSELTRAYVDLRFFQASLAEQRRDLASRRRTLTDVGTLLAQGSATQLDRIEAEALVAETRARIPDLEARIAQAGYRIATLLGTPAGALGIDLRATGRQPVPPALHTVGIPADLVRRRPDIAQAERLFAAAVSEVSAAEAARYPSLSLSGQIVTPLSGGGGTANGLTAGLVLPLFNQPGLAAGVDAAQARADQAYLQWRGSVLSAVEEVETALAAIAGSRQAVAGAARVVALNTEALDLSRQLLDGSGDITVLDLLDRERNLSQARSTLSQSRRDYALNAIGLYVALGLGVPETGPTPAGQAAP